MPLTLCPNCRLPVNASAQQCPLCTASLIEARARHVPIAAAAIAVVATTVALVARRWA